MRGGFSTKNIVSNMHSVTCNYCGTVNLTGSPSHNGENELFFTDIDDIRLSDADRSLYQKTFSSILVPYTVLTVGEEIGHGG